ncbi:hypothetical protein UFOVP54_204 [uncultured Caudovirales phage]|uniref:Uncharacterized protein n=1 Tax=uncultured Caudovirales phage TaxID=2100421 RepID=A0A6J5KT39_9CAUD|nr:hypothetical protein UFOVP54_204 [uncultured Caudovirales phage]
MELLKRIGMNGLNNLKRNKIMTAVEYLLEKIKKLTGLYIADDEPIVQQAKEMEKEQQGYNEEDMKLAFEYGHKKGFSGYPNTENWKELPFKEWFEQFKKK